MYISATISICFEQSCHNQNTCPANTQYRATISRLRFVGGPMKARFFKCLLGVSWQAILLLRVKLTAKTMMHILRSFVCLFDVLYPSQRSISHVGTFSCLPQLNQY